MTEPTRLKELLSKLRVASSVLEYLPALPGYNGSILTIDDTEAARIAKDLDEVVDALSAPQAGGDETPVAWDYCWLVELRPAFEGHPSFPATYYAGWKDGLDAAKTADPNAAPRFTRKEDAERVAAKLGHTLSCVWKASTDSPAPPRQRQQT
jgi:hypothetical protein